MSGKSFHAADPASHQGKTNTWFTPRKIFNGLGTKFDLDPCTQSFRPFDTAQTHYCYDQGEDGLKLNWRGNVWLNPPYGKETYEWLRRLDEHAKGIALVFSRTDTIWFQEIIQKANACNFLKGRISFIDRFGNQKTNAATGSVLFAWGKSNVKALYNIPGYICIN